MLKKFFRDSVIYGTSNVLSRGISILLVPLYTRVLLPSDYGVIDMLRIVAALARPVFTLEITQGMARYYSDTGVENEQVAYASTVLWFTMGACVIFLSFCFLLPETISGWILDTPLQKKVFLIGVTAVVGNLLFYTFQNQLRWDFKPGFYGLSGIAYTLFYGCSAVVLVVWLKYGVVGVFFGQIIGYFIAIIIAWGSSQRHYRVSFDYAKCRKMLAYSIPLVFTVVGSQLAVFIDRIALRALMSLREVGLYGVGYRFASIVGLLFMGFSGALSPLVLKHYKKPDTPFELSRIFRYFLLLMLFILMVLTLFSHEILIIFTTPVYYSAAPLIPILALVIVLTGMRIFAPGMHIARKTHLIAILGISAAVGNTVLNFLLIPVWGIMGAALSTLFSTFFFFTCYMVFSQKFYYIPYAWGRTFLSVGLAGTFSVAGLYIGYIGATHFEWWIIILLKVFFLLSAVYLIGWIMIGKKEVYRLFSKKLSFINLVSSD